jgi:hypothetical protein
MSVILYLSCKTRAPKKSLLIRLIHLYVTKFVLSVSNRKKATNKYV